MVCSFNLGIWMYGPQKCGSLIFFIFYLFNFLIVFPSQRYRDTPCSIIMVIRRGSNGRVLVFFRWTKICLGEAQALIGGPGACSPGEILEKWSQTLRFYAIWQKKQNDCRRVRSQKWFRKSPKKIQSVERTFVAGWEGSSEPPDPTWVRAWLFKFRWCVWLCHAQLRDLVDVSPATRGMLAGSCRLLASIFRSKMSLERSFTLYKQGCFVSWMEEETAKHQLFKVCWRINFTTDWTLWPQRCQVWLYGRSKWVTMNMRVNGEKTDY